MTVQTSSGNNKRIAKNTLLLYFRMIFMMAVSLYTSRVVLNTLGVEDFGIYNVIGGVVAMFSVISGGLSAAISRYITFELGQGNTAKLKSVFSSSVTIQIGLALLIFVLAEIGGVWFLNEKMNLPESRIGAANWVLQCSILTFMVNLISVPYNAAIIAHERMQAFAYISIIEVVLKLLIVYILVIFSFDKLKLYGILLLAVACVIRIAYGIYCKRNFKECTYHFTFNKALLKEMMGFAGWNFIGAFAGVLRDQGVNIVINLFCGPVINAARAIAFQVNVAVNGFATNFMTAINPQITKSYAAGDYEHMWKLVFNGTRYSFFLLAVFMLPLCFNIDFILSLWLKEIPAYTNIFVILLLANVLAESYSTYLITVLLATGKIAFYQASVGTILLLNVPLSYLVFQWGCPPVSFLVVSIVLTIMALIMRLWLLKKMLRFSVLSFLKQVVLKTVSVSLLICLVNCAIYLLLPDMYGKRIIFLFSTSLLSILLTYLTGLNNQEKTLILQQLKKRITFLIS